MKNPIWFFAWLMVISGTLWSCDQISLEPLVEFDELTEFLTDSLGVDACVNAASLAVSDLPSEAQSYLESNYADDWVSSVLLYQSSQDSLYEVSLSRGDLLIFDIQGNLLPASDSSLASQDELIETITDGLELGFPSFLIENAGLVWAYGDLAVYELGFFTGDGIALVVKGTDVCYVRDDD
ncbi:MAG: hypothetical protein AAF804_04375 [Bacteroidota bacterium]